MRPDRNTEVIDIVPARSRRELAQFLELPLRLHDAEPCYVPMPMLVERAQLSRWLNPFWRHAGRELFLARRGGKVVGRIAAIADDLLDAANGQRVGAWGYFACENVRDTAEALFRAVENFHAGHAKGGAIFLRGPLNPSLNHSGGMLVSDFDKLPPFAAPYNPPYYPQLAEGCGMEKEQDLLFYRFSRSRLGNGEYYEGAKRLAEESGYRIRWSEKKNYAKDMDLLVDLFNRCWSENWGYTPLNGAELRTSWLGMRIVRAPTEIAFFEHKGTPVGVALIGGDISPLLKDLGGRISLSSFLHIFQKARFVTGVRIALLGILQEHRFGLAPLLLLRNLPLLAGRYPAVEYLDGGWTLEDNAAINDACEKLGGELIHRSRIYRREAAHG